MSAIPGLHAFYEYILSLPESNINAFCGIDWGAFILSIVLG